MSVPLLGAGHPEFKLEAADGNVTLDFDERDYPSHYMSQGISEAVFLPAGKSCDAAPVITR